MPFQKGKSGNANGRPVGLAEWRKGPTAKRLRELSHFVLEEAAKGYLSYRHPEKPDVLSYEMVDPDARIKAAHELLDRVDGKAPQEIELLSQQLPPEASEFEQRQRLEALRERYPDLLGMPGHDHEDA